MTKKTRPLSIEERAEYKARKTQVADEKKLLKTAVYTDEVRSEDGQHLIYELEDVLRKRVEKLMADDPFCQGLTSVLQSINITLDVGDKLIKETFEAISKVAQ